MPSDQYIHTKITMVDPLTSPTLGEGKSATLRWLASRIGAARVPPFLVLPLSAWRHQPNDVLDDCRSRLGDCLFAVRSDATVEDGLASSAAGKFVSLLDVPSTELEAAIDTVAASLPGDAGDAIIVQAMVTGIVYAGVASSHRIRDGAPWYCIEWAEVDSAAVTAGRATDRQVSVLRRAAHDPDLHGALDGPVKQLLDLLQEIEQLANGQPLEIEFALAKADGEELRVFLLQARPIASSRHWRATPVVRLPALDFLHVEDPLPAVVGDRSLLSLMSDWNPAELIGVHPRPLSLSLFRWLIADGIWWRARAALGYASPPADDVSLLHPLLGRPLVDLRRSANSLLPEGLPNATGRHLVNQWMDLLGAVPALHDKVEFQIYRTIRDFESRDSLKRRWADALGTEAWLDWECRLGALARRNCASGTDSALRQHLDSIDHLTHAFPAMPWQQHLVTGRRGTFAFAALARLAFIGEAQLRSAVARGALDPERALALRSSARADANIDTQPAGSAWQPGHLRPGTFDLTQPSWAALAYQPEQPALPITKTRFGLRGDERRALHRLLDEVDLGMDADAWIAFVQQSASAREWAKFVFSRHVSLALDGIADTLAAADLDRECGSWLTLGELEKGLALQGAARRRSWMDAADAARQRHATESTLILSPLLRNNVDRSIADNLGSLPNFVGRLMAEGPLRVVDDATARSDTRLHGAVVVLRQADPGYDWLFDCRIGGLITAWGGANSHLAIRCAESGLSAAIGCGEAVHDRACRAVHARIDPVAEALWLT